MMSFTPLFGGMDMPTCKWYCIHSTQKFVWMPFILPSLTISISFSKIQMQVSDVTVPALTIKLAS